jgi:hypothetical protein
MLVAKKSVSIELECNTNDFKKGSPIDVVVRFRKNIPVPTPFINVTLGYSKHLCNYENLSQQGEFPQLKVSMAFEKQLECSHRFKANVFGRGQVYLKEAYIYDYLGFFRTKLTSISNVLDVYITPSVRDINSSQTLFNSICNSVISNDEEEENNQNTTLSVSSNLGYLHREYVQGDSPRRINWKLSCKRDKLMVRLDEPSPQSKPCIVLDMSISKEITDSLKRLQNFENLVESALSLANMCVKNGIECTFMLCNCENFREYVLTSVDDVFNVALAVSHGYENGKHRLPESISKLKTSDSMYLLFTDYLEGTLKSEVDNLKSRGFAIESILSPRYYGMYTSSEVWVVNRDLSISQSGY